MVFSRKRQGVKLIQSYLGGGKVWTAPLTVAEATGSLTNCNYCWSSGKMRQATAATTAATASATAATVRASTFGSRPFYLDELSFQALFCPCFPLFPGWGKDIKLQKLVCLIAFVFLSLMVQCGGDGDNKCHLAFVWENHTGYSLWGTFLLFHWWISFFCVEHSPFVSSFIDIVVFILSVSAKLLFPFVVSPSISCAVKRGWGRRGSLRGLNFPAGF